MAGEKIHPEAAKALGNLLTVTEIRHGIADLERAGGALHTAPIEWQARIFEHLARVARAEATAQALLGELRSQ